MVTLNLNPQEAEQLHEILASYLSDLRMEIADTDRLEFREMLKQREVLLKSLLRQLTETGGRSTANLG